MEKKRYTLAIMVDNESGVLSRVASLFSRKGYNIESIAAGTLETPDVTRITIEVLADDDNQIHLLCNQVSKRFPVHSVKLLNNSQSIRRELVLIKVKTENSEERNEIIQISNIFRASIVDVATNSLTIAIIGEEEKTEAIINLLQKHGILEMGRTGILALERGAFTLDEDTKVRGEFDYGKNVR